MAAADKQNEPFQRKIISSIIRVDRLHRQTVENAVSGKIKIHRSQHHFLMHIARSGNLASQKELADSFQVSPACVTVALKKLETDGYIIRNSTEDDSRKNEITITDSGRKIVNQSKELFDEIDKAALDGIPDCDLEAMRLTLDRIYENLSRIQNEKSNKN